jgi:hypothetical protein
MLKRVWVTDACVFAERFALSVGAVFWVGTQLIVDVCGEVVGL